MIVFSTPGFRPGLRNLPLGMRILPDLQGEAISLGAICGSPKFPKMPMWKCWWSASNWLLIRKTSRALQLTRSFSKSYVSLAHPIQTLSQLAPSPRKGWPALPLVQPSRNLRFPSICLQIAWCTLLNLTVDQVAMRATEKIYKSSVPYTEMRPKSE